MSDEWVTEKDLSADEKVKSYILKTAEADNTHVCSETTVSFVEGADGFYGCDTGCEYARLEATLTCPHFPKGVEVEYGEWGRLHNLLADIDEGG